MKNDERHVWWQLEESMEKISKQLHKAIKGRKGRRDKPALYKDMLLESIYILSEELTYITGEVWTHDEDVDELKKIAKKLRKAYRTASGMVST